MNTRWLCVTLCAAMLAVGTLDPRPALAATDDKYYPGAMCVQTSAGGAPTYQLGSIGNLDPFQELVLECPAVRDQVGITRAWVRVTDASSTASITCQLFAVAFYPNATPAVTSQQVSSSGAQQVEELNLGVNALVDSRAHYFMRCTIPPKFTDPTSYIRTYGIVEGP